MGMRIWWQHIFPPQEQIERETGMTLSASVEDAKGRVLENLRTGVPIVDVTHAAVKLAETLVDLKRAAGLGKSKRRTYKSAPPAIRDAMRSLAYCAPGK
jgi:hypothetical protein